MSRSKFNNALAVQLDGVIIAPNEEKKQWTWVGAKAPAKPTARTTSSTLARAIVVGEKQTGHPEGATDLDEQCKLLMMDIMDSLK